MAKTSAVAGRRRQRAAVEPDARAHLLGGGDPAAGLEAFPSQQVAQGAGGRSVAALGERAAPFQLGHGAEGEMTFHHISYAVRDDLEKLIRADLLGPWDGESERPDESPVHGGASASQPMPETVSACKVSRSRCSVTWTSKNCCGFGCGVSLTAL